MNESLDVKSEECRYSGISRFSFGDFMLFKSVKWDILDDEINIFDIF